MSRLAAAVEQQRLQLQGSVPAHAARQQAEELRAQLGQAREAREEASRQAEATSHRLIELETTHARCGMEGSARAQGGWGEGHRVRAREQTVLGCRGHLGVSGATGRETEQHPRPSLSGPQGN